MLAIKNLAFFLTLMVPVLAAESTLRAKSRKLNPCDTFKACYLINIKTGQETLLDGFDSFTIDRTNEKGYTIRCDSNNIQQLHFMKFFYNGTIYDDFAPPRYIGGDYSNVINKVDYLSTCGRKVVLMEGHVWDKKCFNKTLVINARNPVGIPCGAAPVNAPVTAPVKSPVKAPVTAPVKAPVTAPVKAPITAPVKAPITAPVKAPVTAPVKAPTSANCSTTVSGFTLVDATTHEDIMPLGTTNRKDQINIRANIAYCKPKVIDSMLLQIGNLTRCERHAPYSMWGDESNQDVPDDMARYYFGTLTVGKNTITATPYAGRKCDGQVYESFSQEFIVV